MFAMKKTRLKSTGCKFSLRGKKENSRSKARLRQTRKNTTHKKTWAGNAAAL
jgi:hypothetical protein